MRRLVLGTGMGLPIPQTEQIEIIKKCGFDGAFTNWQEDIEEMERVAAAIRLHGLLYHSIHAPFDKVHHLWETQEEGEAELARQIRCLEVAARLGVDLVIMHTIIGMDRHTPTELGIARYAEIFDAAKHLGVRIALENTEGEEYLEALMNASCGDSNVGFCIDTGHEMCYNGCRDMIGKYGHRLFSTHLNDNMGQTGDALTWLDDAHMLPFDGVADWRGIAERLEVAGYRGDLTFELTTKSKPGRCCNDRYAALTPAQYIETAYQKACLVRDLFCN